MHQSIIIACVGSPYGADAISFHVSHQLEAYYRQANPDIQVQSYDRPGMTLLSEIQSADLAIIIDAVTIESTTLTSQPTLQYGDVLNVSLEEVYHHDMGMSSHNIGVAETLAMGETLAMLPKQLYLLGIFIGEKRGTTSQAISNDRVAVSLINRCDDILAQAQSVLKTN